MFNGKCSHGNSARHCLICYKEWQIENLRRDVIRLKLKADLLEERMRSGVSR